MKKISIFAATLLAPVLSFAQTSGTGQLQGIQGWIQGIKSIVSILIPIAAGLALLYFFYGLAKFILNSGDEEARGAGKQTMIWGIVALFVISSVWGITTFLGQQIGITNRGQNVNIPTFNEVPLNR
jgi:hypothetical protein